LKHLQSRVKQATDALKDAVQECRYADSAKLDLRDSMGALCQRLTAALDERIQAGLRIQKRYDALAVPGKATWGAGLLTEVEEIRSIAVSYLGKAEPADRYVALLCVGQGLLQWPSAKQFSTQKLATLLRGRLRASHCPRQLNTPPASALLELLNSRDRLVAEGHISQSVPPLDSPDVSADEIWRYRREKAKARSTGSSR
jgi:hypothetical protein